MKQYFIAWLCVLALACSHLSCAQNLHTVDRAENAAIGAAHQIALEKCFTNAVATVQTTQDRDKADAEYKVCADAADKAAGRK